MNQQLVRLDGTLNEALIARREKLYRGNNGQLVERLYLVTGESVIFKPLTNDSQLGREAWVYSNVLPLFPAIYPRLLAYSGSGRAVDGYECINPAAYPSWCVFEDLGSLLHDFQEDTAAALMSYIAQWHALPVGGLQRAGLIGPKPRMELLVKEVAARAAELDTALSGVPNGSHLLERVLSPLRSGSMLPPSWTQGVLSHGDLHLGNYGLAAGELKVLDWEHVHLNSPFWDLYHVLDLSHPDFPKAMSADVRERLLSLYVRQSACCVGQLSLEQWKREYAHFSAVFSLWMLLLIQQDLASLMKGGTSPVKWSSEQLVRQRLETLGSFQQCSEML